MISKPLPMPTRSSALPELRPETFRRFQELIRERAGIFLGVPKRQLLISRLGRRLKARGCADFEAYLDLVLADEDPAGEFQEMINRITTNKTDFFREPHHFRHLENEVLARMRASGDEPPRIWSAGCSTGEEPYSIAMVLASMLPPGDRREVLVRATDIDTQVLLRAAEGVYPLSRFHGVAEERWQPWFLRGTGRYEGTAKAREELRRMIAFEQHNLTADRWPDRGSFDVIFCRNTLIYFDRPTQQTVVKNLARCLREGGTLFLGHSENMLGDTPELVQIGQTTFERRTGAPVRSTARPKLEERPFEARVYAGGMFCSGRPAVVRTLLGSCVAACLFDPKAGIGGMNHFLLPEGRLEGTGRALAYGVHAMETLVNEIMQRGGERRRLRAKLFGAASVLSDFAGGRQVAERNQAFARRYLEAEGIELVAHKLGGERPLDVRFETHTGRAFVRDAGSSRRRATASREVEYFRQISDLAAGKASPNTTVFGASRADADDILFEDAHD